MQYNRTNNSNSIGAAAIKETSKGIEESKKKHDSYFKETNNTEIWQKKKKLFFAISSERKDAKNKDLRYDFTISLCVIDFIIYKKV